MLLFLYEINAQTEPYRLDLPKQLPTYATTFIDTAPNVGGYGYSYTATAYSGLQSVKNGITNPIVDIKSLQSENVQNTINIETRVQSLEGVNKYQLYAHKYDEKIKRYRPIHVNKNLNGKYCSFRCEGVDCNLLEEKPGSGNDYTFTFSFDTTKCDNKKFMVNATGYDNYPNSHNNPPYNYNKDNLNFTINNPNPPCIDQCFPFNTQVLNTVYLKIKSWIV